MFDIGMWELMVVGIVMLLVVGPKELPALLRTIGKYAGMLKRQANEFRAQFDEAIRESEFTDIKKDMEELGQETEASLRESENALNEDMAQFDDHSNLDDDDYDTDSSANDVDSKVGGTGRSAGPIAQAPGDETATARVPHAASDADMSSSANGSADKPTVTRKEFAGEFVPGELIDDGQMPATEEHRANGKGRS